MSDEMITTERIRACFAGTEPVPENSFRHYSVLIPLIEREDGIHVLYEVRAKDLDRQPGEICFPGGQQEEEETYEQCALRETSEELGIPPESVEIVSELTTIYGVGKFAMHCFIGIVDPDAAEEIHVSTEEVDRVFTVPLQDLMDAEPDVYRAKIVQYGPDDFPYEKVTGASDYPWSRFTNPVPVFDVDGWAIWGLTGRATLVLTEELKKRGETK